MSLKRANIYHPFLMAGFAERNFKSLQIAHFLAQVGHESLSFIYTKEIWGPTPAQLRYEGRKDLGNVIAGDGLRFMGRELIQVTGRANYRACSIALFGDERLLQTPELLEQPAHAVASAFWFLDSKGIGQLTDLKAITRKINGGLNGLKDRQERFERAVKTFAQ